MACIFKETLWLPYTMEVFLAKQSPRHVIIRGDERYFIELIGLKVIHSYAPLRVLHQFGQIQMIPLHSNMRNFEYNFESDVPRVDNIERRWERVMTLDIIIQQPFCTPEYYARILEDAEDKELSIDGLPGFADERERMWAQNSLYNKFYPAMETKTFEVFV